MKDWPGVLGGFIYRRRWWIVIVAVLLTLVGGYLAGNLQFRSHLTDTMPEEHPQVKAYLDIMDEFDSSDMVIVVVQGEDPEQLGEFAERLAPRLDALDEYVGWVNYRLDDEYITQHGLMLAKASDLEKLRPSFATAKLDEVMVELNNSLEETYIGGGVEDQERENEAIASIAGLHRFASRLAGHALDRDDTSVDEQVKLAVRELSLGDRYIYSPDRTVLMMWLQPNFSMTDYELMVDGINGIEVVCKETATEAPFNGAIEVGLAGALALGRDEMMAGQNDMQASALIALVMVLLALILFFGMLIAPLLAGVPLIMALVWSSGAVYLYSGNLNMMSMIFAVLIIGLGIDYAIHQIAAYNEARSEGHDVEESIKQGLQRCGRGIVTGALTTAAAFLALMFTSMDGMQDMGFVSGVSILLALLAMMFLLPALLAIRDLRRTKRAEKRGREVKRPRGVTVEFGVLGGVGRLIERHPYIFAIAGLLIAGGMLLVVSNKTEFDYNIYNMEPKGLESIELAHLIEDEFDVSPDQSLIITDSVERSREIYDKLKNKGYVGDVDTISRYLPTIEEQERRSPVLAAIVEDVRAWEEPEGFTTEQVITLADELERLQDNLLEMRTLAELGVRTKLQRRLEELIGYHAEVQPLNELAEALRENPESAAALLVDFQRLFYEERQEWLLGSAGTPGFANPATVSEDDLTENITARYLSRSGEKYLVTILPRFDLWSHESRLRTFSEGVSTAEPESVGISQLFIAIIELVSEEGQSATLIALGVIFVLLLVDFRKLHTSLLALVPLVSGGLIMLGVMALLGEKLNYTNVMALPLILGIGIDDSVHIIHRYRHERRLNGDGLIMGRTLSRTGRAVFLTSLTTGIGFGSLMFSRMQGLASMGIALLLGVIACFLTSTFFLPALLKTFERWGLKI